MSLARRLHRTSVYAACAGILCFSLCAGAQEPTVRELSTPTPRVLPPTIRFGASPTKTPGVVRVAQVAPCGKMCGWEMVRAQQTFTPPGSTSFGLVVSARALCPSP